MTRREFLTAASALSVAAGVSLIAACGADTPSSREGRAGSRIGYLSTSWAPGNEFPLAFKKLGYKPGDIIYEPRSAVGNASVLPKLASELAGLNLEVIVAGGGPALAALLREGVQLPIVALLQLLGDLEPSTDILIQRPQNVTGLIGGVPGIWGKRMELLQAVAPSATKLFAPWNSASMGSADQWQGLREAAKLGMQVEIIEVPSPQHLATAFEEALAVGAQGLLWSGSVNISNDHAQVARLALLHNLPSVSDIPRFSELGGLLSYAPDTSDWLQRTARLVDRLLRGERAGTIPVERPTKFDLVINTKTATALSLTIPRSALLQATRVIS